jgi:glycosyltransferase involved in cell wall biosynthesis
MEKVMVSIIMPNYNGAKYIKESIESVLDQSNPEFELIIVDDGSTDNSLDIARQFQDNRISVVCRSDDWPKGANACRNIGIEKAKGEYLLFLDSDDLLDKDCVKNRKAYMKNHPSLHFAVFNTVKFVDKVDDGFVFTRLSGNDPIIHIICTDNLWQTSSVLWRRDFVNDINGYNLKYQRLQDPEMTLRALLASKGNYKLVSESQADTYYRRPPKLSNKKMETSYHSMLLFIKDFYVEENREYIIKENSFLMFLMILTHHINYCKNDNDKKAYVNCVEQISKFNPSVKNNIFYKICKNTLLFPMIRNRFITVLIGGYKRFYINYILSKI